MLPVLLRERNKMKMQKKDLIGEEIMCGIDVIITKKTEKLTGHGLQLAFHASDELYGLKEAKAPNLEIFDKMAELCRILKENVSETKGKQQQLLGL